MEFLIFLFILVVFLVIYFYIGSRIATRYQDRIFKNAKRKGTSDAFYGPSAATLARRYTVLVILFWGVLAPFYAIINRYQDISDKAEEEL